MNDEIMKEVIEALQQIAFCQKDMYALATKKIEAGVIENDLVPSGINFLPFTADNKLTDNVLEVICLSSTPPYAVNTLLFTMEDLLTAMIDD